MTPRGATDASDTHGPSAIELINGVRMPTPGSAVTTACSCPQGLAAWPSCGPAAGA